MNYRHDGDVDDDDDDDDDESDDDDDDDFQPSKHKRGGEKNIDDNFDYDVESSK